MKIEIEVPDGMIADAALKALRIEFAPPAYIDRKGGDGYEIVREQVRSALGQLDVSAIAKMMINQLVPSVARDIVTQELKAAVKAAAKTALKTEPELFKQNQ